MSLPDILRCQQSLEPLEERDGALHAPGSGLTYPVRDGLVFMGYDESDAEFMELTMEEERSGQAESSPEEVASHLAFLTQSAPLTVDSLNVLRRLDLVRPGARMIDVGGGSGWVSWLAAEAGYDPWIIDFEANSLWLGEMYEHERLPRDRRIVGAATALPFADATFGLAMCKQFAHHLDGKAGLFTEISRVLEPGGVAVVMEPVRSLWRAYQERFNDIDEGHSAHAITWSESYLADLRRAGFELVWRGRYFHGANARLGFTSKLKQRALDDLREGRSRRDPLNWLYEHAAGGGGNMVAIVRKTRDVPGPPRPRIRLIEPARLTATEADRDAFRPLAEALPRLGERLIREPSTAQA